MTDLEALILTLYGEARGEPIESLIGVANVIRRRVLDHYRGDLTFAAVCLHPAQFSCWIDAKDLLDKALAKLQTGTLGMMPPDLARCKEVAKATLAGTLADNTFTANHYLAKELYDSPSCPGWAKGLTPTRTLGNHVFLSLA